MFGLREKHIDRILATSRQVYEGDDLRAMGWWCVLPLACGAVYGRTMHGAVNTFEALDVHRSVMADLAGEVLPENLAADLCDYLVEQVDDPFNRKIAEERISERLTRHPELKRDAYITFFTLSIVLNSVGVADFDPIATARTWSKGSDRKWAELFSGAGVLFGAKHQDAGEAITYTLLSTFGQPRSGYVREILTFFNSRQSQ